VLAARIDRLPEREKQLLQTAAVIGRELGVTLLSEVAEQPERELREALRALVEAGFLYESALYPEPEYTFVHPLTREVAYASQLGPRRARIHAAVARALQAADPARLEERAGLVAHHLEAAGEAFEAACWHARAGLWAMRADYVETRRHWEKVRSLLAGAPTRPRDGRSGSRPVRGCCTWARAWVSRPRRRRRSSRRAGRRPTALAPAR
jgi:predicted ATPase